MTATFTGTYLAWVTKTAPYCGKARVTLDGGAPTMVDLYSAAEANKQASTTRASSVPGAAYGDHRVDGHQERRRYQLSDRRRCLRHHRYGDARASGARISDPLPADRRPDHLPRDVGQQQLWLQLRVAPSSPRAPPTAQVTINFHGTGLALLAKTGPDLGIATVTLDGAPLPSEDFYSLGTLYLQEVFNTGALADADSHPGDQT